STVAAEIALSVALDVEAPDAAAPLDRLLPDAGVDGPSAPLDVARQSDVDGDQSGHPGGVFNTESTQDPDTPSRACRLRATTSKGRIISFAACSSTWQCQT